MTNNTPTTAMIFAAGFGKRMRPLTNNKPKAMIEVCGKPLIDYRIDKLLEVGVQKIVINTHYLPEIIEDYLQKYNKRDNVEILFSREDKILETGGGLIHALPLLGDEPFYTVNCDTIWLDNAGDKSTGYQSTGKSADDENALARLANGWRDDMDSLLLLQPINNAIGYDGDGDFSLSNDNQISWKNPKYIYTGVQIFNPKILQNISEHRFSISKFWHKHDDIILNNYGIIHKGDWLHIDSVTNLQKAEYFFLKKHEPQLISL